MGRGGWELKVAKQRRGYKQTAVMTKGGSIVMVSRLPKRGRGYKAGGRRRTPPPVPPKMRVPGDEMMRALTRGRSYSSIARGMGKTSAEISQFCRGLKPNPTYKTVERFALTVGVTAAEVMEALGNIWAAVKVLDPELQEYRERVLAIRAAKRAALDARRGRKRAGVTQEVSPDFSAGEELPSRQVPKIRPELARLIGPPAPFLRERAGAEDPQVIGIAARDLGMDGDEYAWD